MRKIFTQHHRLLFFLTWFIINILQAAFTGLMDDEAYYWVYAQYPSWGYFDHPPMIAVLIKMGSVLFEGELGVRFFIVLLNTLTLVLIYQLLQKKDDKLFYAICGSLMLAQIGGILAVPDLPLLFFAALYFLLYKRFIEKMNLLNSLLFAIGIALMLYSKYHGVLLILFTLVSNPSLFSRVHTYIVAIVSILLFAPHIAWQINHDLPSVQYHLFERNATAYKAGFTIEYILGQIALAGPVIGWLLLWASFKQRHSSQLEKTLRYSLVGIYVFFLLSTFKGRVEANWTVPAFVALIVLSHHYLSEHPLAKSWLYKLLPITVVFVLTARLFMAIDIPRTPWLSKDEFHGNEEWVSEVQHEATGMPVVFLNSYQLPSKYWFYSGSRAFGLNTPYYRRNNYNFWPIEDSLVGKRVFVIGRKDSIVFTRTFNNPVLKESGATEVERYFSFSKVQFTDMEWSDVKLAGSSKITQGKGNTPGTSISGSPIKASQLTFLAKSPVHYLDWFKQSPYKDVDILLAAIEPNVGVTYFKTGLTVRDIRTDRQRMQFMLPEGIPSDRILKLCIESCIEGQPSLNSTAIDSRK